MAGKKKKTIRNPTQEAVAYAREEWTRLTGNIAEAEYERAKLASAIRRWFVGPGRNGRFLAWMRAQLNLHHKSAEAALRAALTYELFFKEKGEDEGRKMWLLYGGYRTMNALRELPTRDRRKLIKALEKQYPEGCCFETFTAFRKRLGIVISGPNSGTAQKGLNTDLIKTTLSELVVYIETEHNTPLRALPPELGAKVGRTFIALDIPFDIDGMRETMKKSIAARKTPKKSRKTRQPVGV